MKRNALIFALIIASITLCVVSYGTNTLKSSIQFGLSSDLQTTDFATGRETLTYSFNKSFANGSGTTQLADLVFADTRAVTTGASESLDLYGGLSDKFGTTINFARVKAIFIENTHATQTLTIGGGDAPLDVLFGTATGTLAIGAYGAFGIVAPLTGYAITDSTNDTLHVEAEAGGTTITYKIWIIGGGN